MVSNLYFFPPYRSTEGNPYSRHFKESISSYYNIVEKNNIRDKGLRIDLLKHSFKDDIFVLNWVESVEGRFLLFFISLLSLFIVKLRGKKIVWMMHNIEPHQGFDVYSKTIMRFLYRYANVIIAHSTLAYEMACKKSQASVHFFCHPFTGYQGVSSRHDNSIDIFIWGAITPYKGIAEFLETMASFGLKYRVLILGKCIDKELLNRINIICEKNESITFDNRRADLQELRTYCSNSRYVLFPYKTHSVSSSGALIDTIEMGGNAIGPNTGAFHDLEQEGLCFTYNDNDELFALLSQNRRINEAMVRDYLIEHSWDAFASQFKEWVG